jgi:hypothetical protein
MRKLIILGTAAALLSTSTFATSYLPTTNGSQSLFDTNNAANFDFKNLQLTDPENITLYEYLEPSKYIEMNVLAFYTQELLDFYEGDITQVYAFIEKALEYNNRALAYGGIGIKRNLAGIRKMPDDYDESRLHVDNADLRSSKEGVYSFYDYLTGGAEQIKEIDAIDERFGEYGASYYALFTKKSGPTNRVGQAFLGRNASYTALNSSPLVSLGTFSHEIGHNDGMEHDRNEREFSYSYHMSEYGIASVCDGDGTIMFPTSSFGRVPIYADPNHTVNDTGEKCGVPDVADVARGYREGISTGFIERRDGIMANYREALPKEGFASLVMDATADESSGVIRGTIIWDGLSVDQNAFVNVVVDDYGNASPDDFAGRQDIHIAYTGEATTTFTIDLNDDDLSEAEESVIFKLHAANGVKIDPTQSSDGVTIVSDEVSEPGAVGFAQSSVTGDEGDNITLSLVRENGTYGEITVDVTLDFDTASESDVSLNTQTVTFADGETSKTVTLDILTDENEESAETLSLVIEGRTVEGKESVVVTINDTTDNDTTPETKPRNEGSSGGGSIHFGILGLALMALFRRRV